jgi:hypothetical protein
MIHVVVMKRLIGLPLLIHIELLWRSRTFKNRGVGVGSLKKRGVRSFKNRRVGVGSLKNRGVGVGSFKNRGVGVGSFKNRGVGVGSFKNRGIGVGAFFCTDCTALDQTSLKFPYFVFCIFTANKNSSHFIVMLSQRFPEQFTSQFRRLSHRGTSFSIPCWSQSMSCVTSHCVTTVSTSRLSVSVKSLRFCFSSETR